MAMFSSRREFLGVGASAGLATAALPVAEAAAPTPPNLIVILADDLGYGDLGCYGQALIRTPRLDRMASEGMRFTQFYAGATVCAPSRCVLMTGKHTGHARVRGNSSPDRQSLRDGDTTVAEILRRKGYATALIGKWGLGEDADGGRAGLPRRQGFQHFFGYLSQRHAHNYYPEWLWRNETKIPLRNVVTPARGPDDLGGTATKRVDYSHDLFAEDALRWVREHRAGPFFLYLALTIPHANNEGRRMVGDGAEVPDYGIYADRDWPGQDKGQAAMITRMDTDVGRLLDLLEELGLDDNTLVVFTSDNGPHNEAGHNPARFRPGGPLRGMKRDLYEGGIRVPMIARWPGRIPAGTTSDHISYFGDLMATACKLSGTTPPPDLDSISVLPELLGQPERQTRHDYLYWEFYERRGAKAVRTGKWKAVRPTWEAPLELYDLEADIGETTDLSARFPDIARKLAGLMAEAHQPSPNWKPRRPRKKPKSAPAKQ